jgi:DNA repair exonuclease SbcCD ATPase subunit
LDEKLKQEYAEAMAKVAVLEQSNEELKDVKDKYNSAEAKVTMLERDLQFVATKAESAEQKQQARATHLDDVIFHYKTLEQEHEEVNQKLQRLQAVISSDTSFRSQERALDSASVDESECKSANSSIADQTKAAAVYAKLKAYQGRIKELQKQRDAALEQIKEIEDELRKAKQEAVKTMEAKKAREKDLRNVIEHYKKLQQQHEKTAAKVVVLEAEVEKRLENDIELFLFT